MQFLIATPCNTLCVERGYSILQMVCTLRCNHLKPEPLEIQLILLALRLPLKIQETMMVKSNFSRNDT